MASPFWAFTCYEMMSTTKQDLTQDISTTHTGRPDTAPDSSYIFGGLALFPNMSLSQFVTPEFKFLIEIVRSTF